MWGEHMGNKKSQRLTNVQRKIEAEKSLQSLMQKVNSKKASDKK